VTPSAAFILPSQHRFRSESATLIEVQPSKATVRYRPKRTAGVRGPATGPASTSNNALAGAAPRRRRRSRSALSDGHGNRRPPSPATSNELLLTVPGRAT
jgi:hypothetical protein